MCDLNRLPWRPGSLSDPAVEPVCDERDKDNLNFTFVRPCQRACNDGSITFVVTSLHSAHLERSRHTLLRPSLLCGGSQDAALRRASTPHLRREGGSEPHLHRRPFVQQKPGRKKTKKNKKENPLSVCQLLFALLVFLTCRHAALFHLQGSSRKIVPGGGGGIISAER